MLFWNFATTNMTSISLLICILVKLFQWFNINRNVLDPVFDLVGPDITATNIVYSIFKYFQAEVEAEGVIKGTSVFRNVLGPFGGLYRSVGPLQNIHAKVRESTYVDTGRRNKGLSILCCRNRTVL